MEFNRTHFNLKGYIQQLAIILQCIAISAIIIVIAELIAKTIITVKNDCNICNQIG